jgi:hypothetical protein
LKEILFLIQIFSCFSLFGLIWTIQLVHYPSFLKIDKLEFKDFSNLHSKKISLIVVPIMLLELVSGSMLLILFPSIVTGSNFLGIIIIWTSTLFLSMPLHRKLASGKDEALIEKLIKTNWPRTIIWTLRSFLLLIIAWRGIV